MVLGSCSKKAETAQAAENQEPEAVIVAQQDSTSETVDEIFKEPGDSSVKVEVETLPVFGQVLKAKDGEYKPDMKVETLTVIDFNAVWCGPCKQFAPAFESAAKQFKNVKFVSCDIDACPKTASAFGIQAVPTVVILSPTAKPQTFLGTEDLLPESKFVALIKKSL